MNINTLPDLCLIAVFRNLPSRDLLNIDLVCPRWAALQRTVARQRNSLTLLIGSGEQNLITESNFYYRESEQQKRTKLHNQIEYDWLCENSAEKLSENFSDITHLVVAINDVTLFMDGKEFSILDHLSQYIDACKSNLKSLKLFMNIQRNDGVSTVFENETTNLFGTINGLGTLTHLTLDFQNSVLNDPSSIELERQMELSILCQLTEFCYSSPDRIRLIANSLKNAVEASPPKLTKLELGFMFENQLESSILQNVAYHRLPDRITYMPDALFGNEPEELRFCASRFVSLKRLAIFAMNLRDLSRMLNIVAQSRRSDSLVQLDISLSLDMENLVGYQIENVEEDNAIHDANPADNLEENPVANLIDNLVENADENADENLIDNLVENADPNADPNPLENPPRLESVKYLTLKGVIEHHSALTPLKWNQIFPNLEHIDFIKQSITSTPRCNLCTETGENDGELVYKAGNTNKECVKQMMGPFKNCVQLNTIFVSEISLEVQENYELSRDDLA